LRIVDVDKLRASIPPGGKFTDDGFAHRKATAKFQTWKRQSDFSEVELFNNSMDPNDIKQGSLGDCWLLSAIACVASRPELLNKIFQHIDTNSGLYVVRFYKDGVLRDVAVDDTFPVCFGSTLAFAKSGDAKETWVQVIEKAYAKLHGSYDAIEAGSVSDGLVDMTAGIGSQFGLRGEREQEAIANGSLWARLRSFASDGHLLACGSHSGSDTDISDMGIVQGHAYSILRVEELDGHRLLHVRNPWGQTEWKGRWSDADSTSWTQRMRKKLDFRDSDDGSFWMAFEDFVVHFATVYVCRIMGDDWQSKTVRGEWKGETAGGCTNYDTNVNNPVYRISVKRNLRLLLTLEQKDARGTDQDMFCIGLHLHKARQQGGRMRGAFASSGTYTNVREVVLEVELEPGKDSFLVPSTFCPGEETAFNIKAFWRGEVDDFAIRLE
jgi:hypothetical protein